MKLIPPLKTRLLACSLLLTVAFGSEAKAAYVQTNLVSSNPAYHPQIIDPLLQGSLSIANRPASTGFGGHFWINNLYTGTNTVYVGDVGGTPIFQDSLTFVTIPPSPTNPSPLSEPTGQVFNTTKDFITTIDHPNGTITAPSKFLFAALDGTITSWTDRKQPDGTPDWPTEAVLVIDRYQESIYYGVTVSDLATNNRLYAADFGISRNIEVFDGTFNEITSSVPFSNPFAVEGYSPYNIQTFNGSLYVTYAKPVAGEPTEAETGGGKLAQFDFDGNLLSIWDDGGLLDIPAGLAIAPNNFGEFSNALLVANFGNGKITAFDQNSKQAIGYLQDPSGNPVSISGLWGLTFGNGKSLGELNHLYFSASPQDGSTDGLFGKLQSVPESSSTLAILLIPSFLFILRFRSNL